MSEDTAANQEIDERIDARRRNRIKIHNEKVKLVAAHYDRAASNLQVVGFIAPVASALFGLNFVEAVSAWGRSHVALIAAGFIAISFVLHGVARDRLNEIAEED